MRFNLRDDTSNAVSHPSPRNVANPTLKALERKWKGVVLRGTGSMLPTPARGVAPDWGARPHRVLYLRHDRIGDMIMATGLIRAVATSHPNIELDVVASPVNATVLDGNPHVRRVIRFDRHASRSFPVAYAALRRGRYDAVIDGMVLTPSVTTMMLMLASGARWRIGIGGRGNDFVYTLPVDPPPAGAHHIEWSARTALPFGVDIHGCSWRPEIFLTDREREAAERRWGERLGGAGPKRVFANISAALAYRQWPEDRFVMVLRYLRRRLPRARILVTSAPHEEKRAATIAAQSGVEWARSGLREAFALVGASDLVFTPDTSIAHVASAFDVPAVVMMVRGTEPFMPWANRGIEVWGSEALQNLEAGTVIAATEEALEKLEEEQRAG